MVFSDGPDKGVHRVDIALVPEAREGAALEFAAIAGAKMRSGKAEGEAFALVEFEDEGIGEGFANLGWVDVLAFGRAARAANRVPVLVKCPGAGLLHLL